MNAGSSSGSRPMGPARFGLNVVAHGGLLLGLGALLLVGCGNKSQPQKSQAPAPNTTSAMFQKMNENRPPLPKPPTEDAAAPAAGAGAAAMGATAESPECKALADEEKAIRAEIDTQNSTIVSPAAERAEAAAADFQACQEDGGCVNDEKAYGARAGAYRFAKKAAEQAEAKVQELEARLFEISQKMAAKCNTDPL